MSELLTSNEADNRTDQDAVQEMYTQAINNGALSDSERELLEEAASEVGTTVDQLAKAHEARKQAAERSMSSEVAKHALDEANNLDYWTKSKE